MKPRPTNSVKCPESVLTFNPFAKKQVSQGLPEEISENPFEVLEDESPLHRESDTIENLNVFVRKGDLYKQVTVKNPVKDRNKPYIK